MRSVTDMMGRPLLVPHDGRRIVSLVPSQTALLHALGVGPQVVGVTKFCIHPAEARKNAQVIGGTKQIHFERIQALEPDLIIGNKEENTREIVTTLEQHYPVWMSDIADLGDALRMISDLGDLIGRSSAAGAMVQDIQARFADLPSPASPPLRVAYMIWTDPWMAAGRDTFIHDMLEKAGYANAFADCSRYPECSPGELLRRDPDLVFLSSEPYPFRERHRKALSRQLGRSRIFLVDGTWFSWYGSHLLEAPAYFRLLADNIREDEAKPTRGS